MKQYIPHPIDTSDITLSEELLGLTERMARNVHEVWAKQRMQEGWHWGKQRDDVQKLHPCLVPYDDLPEAEKEYDRNTAIETLKMIMKLGFEITKHGKDEKR